METTRFAPWSDKKVGSGRQQEGLAQKNIFIFISASFLVDKRGDGVKILTN